MASKLGRMININHYISAALAYLHEPKLWNDVVVDDMNADKKSENNHILLFNVFNFKIYIIKWIGKSTNSLFSIDNFRHELQAENYTKLWKLTVW